jgi:hypothetical protein
MNRSQLRAAILDGTAGYLTSAEVGVLFDVGPKTPGIWKKRGKIEGIYTPGHQLRFRAGQFRLMLIQGTSPAGPRRKQPPQDPRAAQDGPGR